jgi:hypothetical protein
VIYQVVDTRSGEVLDAYCDEHDAEQVCLDYMRHGVSCTVRDALEGLQGSDTWHSATAKRGVTLEVCAALGIGAGLAKPHSTGATQNSNGVPRYMAVLRDDKGQAYDVGCLDADRFTLEHRLAQALSAVAAGAGLDEVGDKL